VLLKVTFEGRVLRKIFWPKRGEGTGEWRKLHDEQLKWEDNIKLELQEICWGGMDWNAVAEDRDRWRTLLNAVMSL
jgi:hypothetical protein